MEGNSVDVVHNVYKIYSEDNKVMANVEFTINYRRMLIIYRKVSIR